MARKAPAKEQIVKLIVGAGQASPSPPEFNALTAHITPGTPIPSVITIRPDRTFHFELRTPPTSVLLLQAAGVLPSKNKKIRGANAPGRTTADGGLTMGQQLAPLGTVGALPGTNTASPGKSLAFSLGGGIGQGMAMRVSQPAGQHKEPGKGGGTTQVGEVSLKHVYEIAKLKREEKRLSGLSLEGLVRSVIGQARSCGVGVVP
ncbi:MAG: hypothetical protein M1828_002346 [Chrysothrix sp. TS-e1954]|nr:MAG: hypothetical protein M1828_002346 [Chrysothrix sp. TS-e1954]